MECNPKKIEALLKIPTKFKNRVDRPGITVAAIVVMLFVLTGVLSYFRYLYLDQTLSTADYRQVVSNVLIFGGTMLTLWELIQAGSLRRNLLILDETALIESCLSSIALNYTKESSSGAMRGDSVKHEDLMSYRGKEQDLRKSFNKDIKFADSAAKSGVYVILAGLFLTPFT